MWNCGSTTLYDGMYYIPTLFSVSSTNFWQSLEGLPMSGKMAAMAWNTVSAGMKAMSFLRCSTILSFSSFSSSSYRCWQFHHEMWRLELLISEIFWRDKYFGVFRILKYPYWIILELLQFIKFFYIYQLQRKTVVDSLDLSSIHELYCRF